MSFALSPCAYSHDFLTRLRAFARVLPLALVLASTTLALSACDKPAAQEQAAAPKKVFSGRIAQF
ncbi:hypothetical protein AB4084_04030, partial [Lysobacter sp. 2RAB21]